MIGGPSPLTPGAGGGLSAVPGGSASPLGRSGASALPLVDRSALPPEVRNGTPDQQRAYRAALGFERTLVTQLMKTMTASTPGAGDGSDGGEDGGDGSGGSGSGGGMFAGSTAAYRDLLTESLSDSVVHAGGLGLARDLYRSLRAQGR